MCTLAWNLSGDNLWVCFNRDESRGRIRAQLPVVHACGQNSVAHARDPEGGGTWLAVSSAGFIVALMNNYEAAFQPDGDPVSRGRLVIEVAQRENPVRAREHVYLGVKSQPYAPFYLFLLSPAEQIMWSWDGQCIRASERCPGFWTTSSFKTRAVFDWRKKEWESRIQSSSYSLAEAIAILRDRQVDPAYSMTMDRPDARTVSQSTICLGRHCMEFRYCERQHQGDDYEEAAVCRW